MWCLCGAVTRMILLVLMLLFEPIHCWNGRIIEMSQKFSVQTLKLTDVQGPTQLLPHHNTLTNNMNTDTTTKETS